MLLRRRVLVPLQYGLPDSARHVIRSSLHPPVLYCMVLYDVASTINPSLKFGSSGEAAGGGSENSGS